MFSFIIAVTILIVGYFTYGVFIERVFGIKPERLTPVKELADGVDYVELPKYKAFLIQFLNIAGTGPIFGAIAGALWGPVAFLWIVFGTIFAGGVHDFLVGMMSIRNRGESFSELVGRNLGSFAQQIIRVFSIVLLVLVGVVFIGSPADIINGLNPALGREFLVWIIIIYYALATILPIDKIIGRIYPIFGVALLLMAIGVIGGIFIQGYQIPEISFENLHPKGTSIFPFLFISIACGAISGFHATQSPLIARCISSEKEGRYIFYGAMVTEGIVALIWAAAAMTFFGGVEQLAQAGTPGEVVNKISQGLLGSFGSVLAVLGVVAAPISSGDTAFRSARLNIADIFKLNQSPIKNRFIIAIPLFVIAIILTKVDFIIIWRYFAWANQTLATFALWTGAVYLMKRGKNYWIAVIPAMFMSVVVTTYIIVAPEGLGFLFQNMSKESSELIGITVGMLVAVISGTVFMYKAKALAGSMLNAD